jgi:hypothetical protein
MVVNGMMTNIFALTQKVITPLVLAIAMLFMTPVVGLLSVALRAPAAVELTSNETVIHKTVQSSIVFKS